ncbi:MAG: glycosyltransferase family 2 protein [Bacteroidetes bacterium]|nr:glycosyltransferase family 2 protein [Bacteroidota bacterium]
MEIPALFFNILLLLVFLWLALSAVYFLFFGFTGLFYRDKKPTEQPLRKIAVLIPGYKEDAVIIDVAQKALHQSYPGEYFEVIVIADSFQPTTLEKLKKLPVRVLEVSFEKSTKAKSLNRAFEILPDYDIAVILDADNIMENDFLKKINAHFSKNIRIIQGHRAAKNLNTSFAILDAVSEEINNHVFRKGHRVVGLSSALIGSGMAFDYRLFKSYMSRIKAVGGFDKELEINLLSDRETIHYLHSAIVYDEKIQKPDAFKGQRRRWLSAQYVYFGRYFLKGLRDFFLKGNIDLLDKILQMALVPRILTLGVTILIAFFMALTEWVFTGLNVFNWFWINTFYWYLLLGVVVLSFFMAVPAKFYSFRSLRALLSLPKGFGLMLLSLLNLKGANKKFIHTRHGQN